MPLARGRRAGMLLLIPLAIWALLAVVRIITNTFAPAGATDLHPCWYAGHFIWHGADAYRAFLTAQQPALPITYLDGPTATALPVAQPNLEVWSALTPALLMPVSLLSWLSWPTAKAVWMVVNLVLMAAIPILTMRLIPGDQGVTGAQKVAIGLVFCGLLATRNAAGNGQTTLIVSALMLGALLTYESVPLLAGLLLGAALSKYTLALPVLVYFLMKRQYRVVAAALVVQLLGVLTFCAVVGTSPVAFADEYLAILEPYFLVDGMHLVSLLPPGSAWQLPLAAAFTVAIGWCLYRSWRAPILAALSPAAGRFADLQILNILVLWGLLIPFHRSYDTALFVLFVAVSVSGMPIGLWQLTPRARYAVWGFVGMSVLLMSRPVTGITLTRVAVLSQLVPQLGAPGVDRAVLLGSLALSIWLLFHPAGRREVRPAAPMVLETRQQPPRLAID